MTKRQLKEMAETYNYNGDFVGYYLQETQVDEIAQKLGLDNEDGLYDKEKIEEYFDCKIILPDGHENLIFPEIEIIFNEK